MKGSTIVRLGATLLLAGLVASCGSADQFGGAFDISRVCNDSTCATLYDQSAEVSVTGDTYKTLYFELHNRMPTSTTETTQTVRTSRAEMRFTAPNGHTIPYKTYAFTVNVEPQAKVIQPITVMDNTQIEYIRDRLNEFPDLPFQVNCAVTVFYTTTGGVSGSVQRDISLSITN